MPPRLMPLLKAGFVEPDIEVGDTVAPRADTSIEIGVTSIHKAYAKDRDTVIGVWVEDKRVRAHRFQRADLVLLEPREFSPKLRQWIVARTLKRRRAR